VLALVITVRGDQVEGEEFVPAADVTGIPDEPPVEGGVLSDLSETQLESRPSAENPETQLFDETSPVEEGTPRAQTNAAQFLVNDALQILSSLSQNHGSSETPKSSIFLRFMWKTFDILKSLSFIQYSSQEEPLSYDDTTQEYYDNALQLLAKAGEMGNSDAMYLLGELNFVNAHG
jgi:hypothetical protein